MVADFSEFLDPSEILFLLRDCHFDQDCDIFVVVAVLDDLSVGKDLVLNFGEVFVVCFGHRFLLVRSHYLFKIITDNKNIKISTTYQT